MKKFSFITLFLVLAFQIRSVEIFLLRSFNTSHIKLYNDSDYELNEDNNLIANAVVSTIKIKYLGTRKSLTFFYWKAEKKFLTKQEKSSIIRYKLI